MRFVDVIDGSDFHRWIDAPDVGAICDTAWFAPAGVSATLRSAKNVSESGVAR